MAYEMTTRYEGIINAIAQSNVSESYIDVLNTTYRSIIYKADLQDKYSEPMKVIGMYIAVASLYCILAMVADLLHGLRRSKLWFPCKYFSVNAFSLAVIAVAMKLPVDLSGNMPGKVDQAAKLRSMAFMCTMMANLLPCLATMGNTELLTNVTALGVLVITLVVNVCIEIDTGVVGTLPNHKLVKTLFQDRKNSLPEDVSLDAIYKVTAAIYVGMLLSVLIIYVCSSMAIVRTKQIIESKYQQQHKAASKSIEKDELTVEKLQHHVSNYWIMAGSSNPQFIQACSVTTAASGVICALTFIGHISNMIGAIQDHKKNRDNYNSDYKWSTPVILMVQSMGGILGTVAPLFRCFAFLSFKQSIERFVTVENYWTQKLYDWKDGHISLPFQSRALEVIINKLKSLILNICIVLQVLVVELCNALALTLFLISICFHCLKWPFQAVFGSSRKRIDTTQRNNFVLQLENENKLAEGILKCLSKSLDQLIKRSEKKHPKNLMKLITERSTKDFHGVRKLYDNNDQPYCWSLAVVTLTTIAITLPNIEKVEIKSLLKSVREGLEYATLVEENLNATDDYKSIQKAAKTLWTKVDFGHKWLGIKLKDIASQGNTTPQIVQLFLEIAESVKNFKEGEERTISICANSMYRITQTIINDNESHDLKLFDELSSRIADIMDACLTNLPQVITMKAHTSVVEKREASVKVAAQLLGETKEIIKILQDPSRHVPSMDPDDLPFFNKWCAYLSEP